MIVISGTLELSSPVPDPLRQAAAAMMTASNAEAGCGHYAFAQDLTNPNLIWISEQWESDEALKAHFASAHMATFQQAMATMNIVGSNITRYEVSSSAPL